ncbi:hypothetical protein AX14_012382 [Amanita brunnescens Koide BX004]|nr:hypothetical protein AX14_012382 [Amanita brunnescens Koide BX004]
MTARCHTTFLMELFNRAMPLPSTLVDTKIVGAAFALIAYLYWASFVWRKFAKHRTEVAKEPHRRTIKNLTIRLLMNFATILTTTMAFTDALFDLSTQPEYVQPMREEIEAPLALKLAYGTIERLNVFQRDNGSSRSYDLYSSSFHP